MILFLTQKTFKLTDGMDWEGKWQPSNTNTKKKFIGKFMKMSYFDRRVVTMSASTTLQNMFHNYMVGRCVICYTCCFIKLAKSYSLKKKILIHFICVFFNKTSNNISVLYPIKNKKTVFIHYIRVNEFNKLKYIF